MARKKKHEEHENLERWLVSYADFMTLLFATFVVLYALSQVDIGDFAKLEDALKKAFQSNIFEGQESIFDSSSSVFEGYDGASNPIMLEYLSPKYEEDSYQEIKSSVDNMKIDGLEASIDDRGLVIKLSDNALMFNSGSADITQDSIVPLDTVAKLIKDRFAIHVIRVEGHTDSDPVSNPIYPSNWELSSARASSVIRHLVGKYNFNPSLFIAAGYADTVPVSEGKTAKDKQKNRRVEIVVLKNKLRTSNSKNMEDLTSLSKKAVKPQVSDAVKDLAGEDEKLIKHVIDFKQIYKNETKRIDKINSGVNVDKTNQRPDFLE